jgi:hypothetical protein
MLLSVASACASGGGTRLSGPARELRATSSLAARKTYKVDYRYTISGSLQAAADTTIRVVQRPPDRLRRIETTTKDPRGNERTVASWSIRRRADFFTCASYGDDVNCLPSPGPSGAFGYSQLDEVAELLADPRSFASVARVSDATIVGERASCFQATPHTQSPPPATSPQPRFVPTRFRFELCFARDGILVKIVRRITGPIPTGVQGTEIVLQATSVSRSVRASDVALPGPVRNPRDLQPSPTRSPR